MYWHHHVTLKAMLGELVPLPAWRPSLSQPATWLVGTSILNVTYFWYAERAICVSLCKCHEHQALLFLFLSLFRLKRQFLDTKVLLCRLPIRFNAADLQLIRTQYDVVGIHVSSLNVIVSRHTLEHHNCMPGGNGYDGLAQSNLTAYMDRQHFV